MSAKRSQKAVVGSQQPVGGCAKRTQFPAPGGTGRQGHGATDKTCKTNPIPGRRDTPPFYCSIIPPFPAGPGGMGPEGRGTRGKCAKQTQFGHVVRASPVAGRANCATSPRCPASGKKPNSSIADCAKQTQFAPRHAGTSGTDRATSPRCPASGNKANLALGGVGRGRPTHSLSLRAGSTKRRLCETKPIRGDAAGDGAWGTRDEGCCTNKPNSYHGADPEIGVPGRANCAKQSQFARLRRAGGATGAWDVGTNAQNEPNSSIADSERPAACRLVPVRAGCTNKPNSTRSRRGSLYKQTQFPRSLGKRQVPYGKRVMVDCTWTGLRQNKANCPKRGIEAVSAVAAVESPIIPVFHHSTIPVRRRLCRTNPIFPAGTGGTRPQGRGARDQCAKQTQFPPNEIPHHSTIPLFHSSNPRGATGLLRLPWRLGAKIMLPEEGLMNGLGSETHGIGER
jgi:hypothetical protein